MVSNFTWQKVEDSVPKDVTPVLVYGECCDVHYNIKIAEIEKGEWWESGTGEDLTFKPTYWMPLPKPPKYPIMKSKLIK